MEEILTNRTHRRVQENARGEKVASLPCLANTSLLKHTLTIAYRAKCFYFTWLHKSAVYQLANDRSLASFSAPPISYVVANHFEITHGHSKFLRT